MKLFLLTIPLLIFGCKSKTTAQYPDRVILDIKPVDDYAILGNLIVHPIQEMVRPVNNSYYDTEKGTKIGVLLPKDGVYISSASFFSPIYLCKGCTINIEYKDGKALISGDHKEINDFLQAVEQIKQNTEKELNNKFKEGVKEKEIKDLDPDKFFQMNLDLLNKVNISVDKISKSIPDSIIQVAKYHLKYYFTRMTISFIGENLYGNKINLFNHPVAAKILSEVELNSSNIVTMSSTYPEFLRRYFYALYYAEKGKKIPDIKKLNEFLLSNKLNNKVRESILMQEINNSEKSKEDLIFFDTNIQEKEYRDYLKFKRYIR
jgi:hypothetical protein